MAEARLEHINLTVRDPLATVSLLVDLFGWHIRWQGEAIHKGFTVHVGGENSYVALYTHENQSVGTTDSYHRRLGLNHLGIVVDDLDATEKKIANGGFTPHLHGDYEPGRRFYFEDEDGLEIEVISYKSQNE